MATMVMVTPHLMAYPRVVAVDSPGQIPTAYSWNLMKYGIPRVAEPQQVSDQPGPFRRASESGSGLCLAWRFWNNNREYQMARLLKNITLYAPFNMSCNRDNSDCPCTVPPFWVIF